MSPRDLLHADEPDPMDPPAPGVPPSDPTLRDALLREILPEGWTPDFLRKVAGQIEYWYPGLFELADRLDALPEKVERFGRRVASEAFLGTGAHGQDPATCEACGEAVRATIRALTGSASEEGGG